MSLLATKTSTPSPALILRLATILYQQQNAPDSTLQRHLTNLPFPSSDHSDHHLLLRLLSSHHFPSSWRPIHRLHNYLQSHHHFSENPLDIHSLLSVYSNSKNIPLLFHTILSSNNIITRKSFVVVAAALADSREVKKCASLFAHVPRFCDLDTLNLVVKTICDKKLVDVARSVVKKVKDFVIPDGSTYGLLVIGYCQIGDLVEASKLWNRMLKENFEPEAPVYLEIVVTMFKNNRVGDGMRIFKLMRENRFRDFETDCYGVVIDWLCKEGKIISACVLFGDMHKRGFDVEDCTVLGSLVYGLLARRRMRDCYKVIRGIRDPDIRLYHGLIKGLLRLKRAGEATDVFREMIMRGCEPIMHTYIMLLQGHLGKRGRKARDPMVNFDNIFVGGLIKAGKTLQATKYVERMLRGAVEVPRFDYNKFLHYFSNEEGAMMFEEVGKKMVDVGMVDLGYIFLTYGERMTTRLRRIQAMNGLMPTT